MRQGKRLSFSVRVHSIVFQTKIFTILTSAKGLYGCAYLYMLSQAALRPFQASRVASKLVFLSGNVERCCVLMSSWNKVTLLRVPRHCVIQGNEEADALATEGSSSTFLGSEPAI